MLTADTVAKKICVLNGDVDFRQYTKVLATLGVVLEDLNLHIFPFMKATAETIGSQLSINLPSDFARIVKVGIKKNGNIYPIYERTVKNVPLSDTGDICDCGCDTDEETTTTTSTGCPYCTWYNVCVGGDVFSEVYGQKPRPYTAGAWQMDYGQRRVLFDSGSLVKAGEIAIIQYKPNMADSAFQLIPSEAVMTIYFRTLHLMTASTQVGVSQAHFKQFRRELKNLNKIYKEVNADDIVAAIRAGYSSAPKRR